MRAVAKYFIALRKSGLNRSQAIERITNKFRAKGKMFFSSNVSWFQLLIPKKDYVYLK